MTHTYRIEEIDRQSWYVVSDSVAKKDIVTFASRKAARLTCEFYNQQSMAENF